ncbi:MAG: glycoside hydrolase family 38 C-terminal domain-containing protein [Acidobacteriaceae bacterium]
MIPHTHWEGAVFQTREGYLEEGLPHILQALYLLRTFPDYRFVLDQAAYVKPFLERYPDKVTEFRSFVSQGRLQIVGGTDVMLDVNIPSGESWVRQVLYGKDYFKQALGIDVTTGWAIDTFGHHAQMPQLLKLAGYKSYWFSRGVRDDTVPSEFLWQGIDGTRIPAFWLPYSYGFFYPAPRNIFQFDGYARGVWDALGKYSNFSNRVALAGADVISPEKELPEMVRAFNAQHDARFQLRFGVPRDFEQLVSRRADQPVVRGELNPVFQGVYSTRIELKQWMREDERILTSSEKLAALAESFGTPPDQAQRWQAWEPVLFNQAHDLSSGTMVDKVYQDTIQNYELAKDLGSAMMRSSAERIASKIDTNNNDKNAIPVLIFNTLGWSRTDVAEAEVHFPDGDVKAIEIQGPDGRKEPSQMIQADRDAKGNIRHATVDFIPHDVPAIGWAIYYVVPLNEQAARKLPEHRMVQSLLWSSASTKHIDSGSIENEFYRATFDLWTGAMTSLDLKSGSGAWQVLGNKPGNIVACEQDGGDSWELYGNLDGGRMTAMTRASGLPEHDRSHFSNEWVGGNGGTTSGPVFSEFHVKHPFGNNSFSTRVRVYKGIQRIDFETTLVNNDKFVRYRLLFPTLIQTGRRFDEIPFAAIQRPENHEFPAQNWMDWSDGKHGVALLNIGLPGSNVSDGTLLLSLMRSARINAYAPVGGYNASSSSDLGLELGETRTFHYALVPHLGNWQTAQVFRAGLELNNPLLVYPLDQHPGKLPGKWGLLDISASNVVMSALMPSEDGHGVIVRVYEAAGQPAAGVKIHFSESLASASEVNLMEKRLQPMAVQENSIRFDLRPFQIKTFRVQFTGGIQ